MQEIVASEDVSFVCRVDVIFASRVDGVGGIEDVDLEEEGRRGVYEEL